MRWRIGIDTGGTFTDVVAWDESNGATKALKIWTGSDPAETITRAIDAIGCPLADVTSITYGTTLVTNALVQGKLPRTVFVATKGFADVLFIARQNRRVLYNMAAVPREAPPILSSDCMEVGGRLDPNGCEVEPIDVASIDSIARTLKDQNVAISVSLLHSYANPAHEEAVLAKLSKVSPYISISSRVSAEAREYERGLVTTLNAALLPTLAGFHQSLRRLLPPGLRVDLFHSAGGMIGIETAARQPAALAMSGPAAGVEAASHVARKIGLKQAISFDMGGTTTDVCLLVGGTPSLAAQMEVGRWMVRQPMVAVESIGAGGGSIVSLNHGRLAIGPQSAGANPGPACYGRGGTQPTLTDAAAILGYLEGTTRLAPQLKIDVNLARGVIGPIAQEFNCSPEAAALGIVEVANAAAARALRRITVDRGIDLRDCALIAFGGAGPMFAASLAKSVGIDRVIIPNCSGALSALGCLLAQRSFTQQQTIRLQSDRPDAQAFDRIRQAMEEDIRREIGKDDASRVEFTYTALMRYIGQSYAIEVPCDRSLSIARLTAEFHRLHQEIYGFATNDAWEMESLRVKGALPTQADWPGHALLPSGNSPSLGSIQCWFDAAKYVDTKLYNRATLPSGKPVVGPALVVDELSTIVVPPDWAIVSTTLGHLELTATRAAK